MFVSALYVTPDRRGERGASEGDDDARAGGTRTQKREEKPGSQKNNNGAKKKKSNRKAPEHKYSAQVYFFIYVLSQKNVY